MMHEDLNIQASKLQVQQLRSVRELTGKETKRTERLRFKGRRQASSIAGKKRKSKSDIADLSNIRLRLVAR